MERGYGIVQYTDNKTHDAGSQPVIIRRIGYNIAESEFLQHIRDKIRGQTHGADTTEWRIMPFSDSCLMRKCYYDLAVGPGNESMSHDTP